VCDLETKRFNEEASKLSNVEIVCISMDLPFAQKRWCGAANVDKVVTASDHREASFGKNYGVLISGGPLDRVLARAVFVIGPDNKVKHVEYVGSIADQPNYDAALAAAKTLRIKHQPKGAAQPRRDQSAGLPPQRRGFKRDCLSRIFAASAPQGENSEPIRSGGSRFSLDR
jgi:peroxiredoxin